MEKLLNEPYAERLAALGDINIDEAIEIIKAELAAFMAIRNSVVHTGGIDTEGTLTPREQLIQRLFDMPDYEIVAVLKYIDQLEDVEDAAISASYKAEDGVPLDDVLAENGFTREEIVAGAKAEGLIK